MDWVCDCSADELRRGVVNIIYSESKFKRKKALFLFVFVFIFLWGFKRYMIFY